MERDYITWEESLMSDTSELHGFNDELAAVVEPCAGQWVVKDPSLTSGMDVIASRPSKRAAQRIAESYYIQKVAFEI